MNGTRKVLSPRRPLLLAAIALFVVLPASAQQQPQKTDAPLPANYVQVSAPFAQRLIVDVKARHSEIVKLGLHATLPSTNDNVIIANVTPSKNGKKSSAVDMEKLAKNKPIAERIDKDKIYDLLIPVTDAKGGDLGQGFVVMEVPFTQASSEAEALKIGVAIRDEIQKSIPSKNALYQR